jgi:membrane-associated protease RseP (regulator of RpoE activity)
MPVRIHPFFWVVGAILGFPRERNIPMQDALISICIWVLALLIAILVHELGHAIAMRFYGFAPRIILYGFGGITTYGPAESYHSRGSDTLGQILICFAGPAAGFLLGGALLAAIALSGRTVVVGLGGPYGIWFDFDPIVNPAISRLIYSILFISLIWGAVNLLPVYPLDGGQIARELFLRARPHDGIAHSLVLSAITGGAMAAVGLLIWKSLFVAVFFGLLAFSSYQALQAMRGRW